MKKKGKSLRSYACIKDKQKKDKGLLTNHKRKTVYYKKKKKKLFDNDINLFSLMGGCHIIAFVLANISKEFFIISVASNMKKRAMRC